MDPSRQYTIAIGDYRWDTDRASTELLGRVRALEVGHSSGDGA
ncbi:MAG: hypothetical protein OXC09_04655 [Truepera sp.]|nr:hypothetical protein [Truepera sp.]